MNFSSSTNVTVVTSGVDSRTAWFDRADCQPAIELGPVAPSPEQLHAGTSIKTEAVSDSRPPSTEDPKLKNSRGDRSRFQAMPWTFALGYALTILVGPILILLCFQYAPPLAMGVLLLVCAAFADMLPSQDQ